MSAVPQFLKRLEARIALALSKAESALRAATSAGNSVSQTNAAPIGPAGSIQFASSPVTAKSGHVRVWIFATVTAGGGTVVAGDQIQLNCVRDGATSFGGPMETVVPTGGPVTGVFISNAFDDFVVAGTTHTWSVDAVCNNAHTISFAVNRAVVIVQELP